VMEHRDLETIISRPCSSALGCEVRSVARPFDEVDEERRSNEPRMCRESKKEKIGRHRLESPNLIIRAHEVRAQVGSLLKRGPRDLVWGVNIQPWIRI
jgi:hypothetical protein